MAILDIFVGVPQSKYAGLAVLTSLLVVSVAILIGRDSMQMSQKFAFVMLIFLVSAPGLLMTLFQITCLVTGDSKGKWWCGAYSWIVSALIIIYSVMLVAIAVISLATGGKVLDDISRADVEKFTQNKNAADAAAAAQFTDKHKHEHFTAPVDNKKQLFTDAPSPVKKELFTDAAPHKTDVVGMDASQTSPELMPVGASSPSRAPVAVPSPVKSQQAYGGGSVEPFDAQAEGFSQFEEFHGHNSHSGGNRHR